MKRKALYIYSTIIIVVVLGWFGVNQIVNNKHLKQVPKITNLEGSSEQLKDQISLAYDKVNDKASGDNIGNLGMVLYSANYYEQAVNCFELASEINNTDWRWFYYLGHIQSELGNSEKALNSYIKVTDLNQDATMAWYKMAELYQQNGKIEEAKKLLMNLKKRNKTDFKIQSPYRSTYFELPIHINMLLSRLYLNEDNYDDAIRVLKGVIDKHKDFGPAYKQLGKTYKMRGENQLAEKYTERSNDLNVYNFPVDTLMDKITLMSASSEYALKYVDIAINGPDTHWVIAVINSSLSHIKDDKFLIHKAVKQYLRMGLGEHAIPYLNKHFTFFKDEWKPLEQIGIALADAGYKKEALKYFDRISELPDVTVENKSLLAGFYLDKTQDKNRAMEYIEKIVEENRTEPAVLGDAAFIYFKCSETGKANKYLQELKRIDPSNPKIYLLNGIKREKEGKKKEAILLFEKAFNLDPNNKLLVNNLGKVYEGDNNWNKAIQFYRKALITFPNDSYLQERLGSILITCPEKSLRDLIVGLELVERAYYNSRYTFSTKISAARSLAIVYYQSANKPKSEYYIGRAIDLAQKSKSPPSYIKSLADLRKQLKL